MWEKPVTPLKLDETRDENVVMICQSPRSFPFSSPTPCPEHGVKLYQLCFMTNDRYVEQSLSQDTLV